MLKHDYVGKRTMISDFVSSGFCVSDTGFVCYGTWLQRRQLLF